MPNQIAICNDQNGIVTTTADGSKTRFDVDAKVSSGSVSIPRYRPAFYNSVTPIALNGATDTVLATINANGQIDMISVNFDGNNTEIALFIDGPEVLRANLNNIDTPSLQDLRHSSSHSKDIYTRGGAHIIFQWPMPVDFDTSIIVKAKHASNSMSAIFIKYRKAF